LKTKIAYVIPTLSLGGAEKQQINILNGMDGERYEIKLFVLKNKTQLLPQLKNKNVVVEICDINSLRSISAMFKFIKNIKDFNPDIIHTHMYNANILARLLKLFLPKSKIINHYHGMSQWMSKPKLFLDKVTSSLVDRFIVVSQKSFDLRLSREKYQKDKIELLYNSVDLNPATETIEKKNNLTIGMASRLIPLKNIEGALFMISELLKKGIKLQLIVAGDGPQKEKLLSYVEELEIAQQVTFLGFVSEMEVFYNQIDIYCISSLTEDLPLSVIEAMVTGKPVIASNIGGIPGIVNNVPCTMLVDDFFDLKEIDAVSVFLKNLELNECREKLVDYAMSNFDNQAYCAKLVHIYDDILESR